MCVLYYIYYIILSFERKKGTKKNEATDMELMCHPTDNTN